MRSRQHVLREAKVRTPAEMVKELRVRLGLTQEQFAAKVGVTFSTVNRWENNRGKPSPLAAAPASGAIAVNLL